MQAYRLTAKKYEATAFSGEGARLAGGRWNPKGRRMVYCSESRALAGLELFVNLDPGVMPGDLVVIPVEVPDSLITEVPGSSLPPDWQQYRIPGKGRHL